MSGVGAVVVWASWESVGVRRWKFSATTVLWFFAQAGGAVVWYVWQIVAALVAVRQTTASGRQAAAHDALSPCRARSRLLSQGYPFGRVRAVE
jgi:hypothetical protein